MRSRVRIGNHPLHPAIVAIPIGAFFLALVADVGFLLGQRPFWAEMAMVALGVGILAALVAAITGLVDYSGLPAGSRARGTATVHMVVNLTAVTLYAVSLYLRCEAEAAQYVPSAAALALSFLAFALLSAGGWLGGKMVFEQGVAVVAEGDSARGRS